MGQRTKARRSMIAFVIFGFCEWNVQSYGLECCCCPTAWRTNSTLRTSRIYGPGIPPKSTRQIPGRQHPPTRITPVGCALPATGPANHARHCGEWGGCHTSDFHLCPDLNLHPRSIVGY
ncbi:uncharacterized protein BJ171DRAFT_502264 [Polychytrium aggregatum]|uniref:uncharacterized protein n=1 Tax=Polychytrium aggregatum TaxID=110093 RepID=UPI0022FE873E|nr:uncharacterized protein BJ171DRAFT_502264 [Polychytrium aggregatum]KAI9205458.1 hypothetical protein BJ171DRAFT_502264 [Polychytrium aggregatum]